MIPIRPSELQMQVYRPAKLQKFPKKKSGKEILPVNRGSGKSGPGKSGSDCTGKLEIGRTLTPWHLKHVSVEETVAVSDIPFCDDVITSKQQSTDLPD